MSRYESPSTDVRHPVVLDLQGHSPEAIADFISQIRARKWGRIADQIEAQTRPPKPDEPTGLGAVVEDTRGRRFTRHCDCSLPNNDGPDWWPNRSAISGSRPVCYSKIDAVRVLSTGVTS